MIMSYVIDTLSIIFQLIEIVGSVLERPLIKEEFTGKYQLIVAMLAKEIGTAQVSLPFLYLMDFLMVKIKKNNRVNLSLIFWHNI